MPFASLEDNMLDSGLALADLVGAEAGEACVLLGAGLKAVSASGWYIWDLEWELKGLREIIILPQLL